MGCCASLCPIGSSIAGDTAAVQKELHEERKRERREYKVLLLGTARAGKTTILNRVHSAMGSQPSVDVLGLSIPHIVHNIRHTLVNSMLALLYKAAYIDSLGPSKKVQSRSVNTDLFIRLVVQLHYNEEDSTDHERLQLLSTAIQQCGTSQGSMNWCTNCKHTVTHSVTVPK